MLQNMDLKKICEQYVVQISMFFLANLEIKLKEASNQEDEMDLIGLLADFRSGFDQRLFLITINHVLLNLENSMLNGASFNKMLNVKNPGEWIKLMGQMKERHFKIKNKADFSMIKDKILDFCEVNIKVFLKLLNFKISIKYF